MYGCGMELSDSE